MRLLKKLDQKGAALGLVVVFTILIVFIGAYVLSAGYNQTNQINAVGIQRTKIYFRAQAGVVDALWRIRTDTIPPGSSGSFATDSFDPPAYYIDIDLNAATSSKTTGVSDVMVDIGPKDASSGLRTIAATGLEK